MKDRLSCIALALPVVCNLLFVASETANADLVIRFGPAQSDNVRVVVDQETEIDVFAVELDGSTALSDDGLLNFGTLATFNPSHGRVTHTDASPLFLDSGSSFDNVAGTLTIQGLALSPPTDSVIHLGSFRYIANNDGNDLFSFGDLNPSDSVSNFTSGDLITDLDPQFFGAERNVRHSLAIQSVPEPSVISVLGLAGLFLLTRRRRPARV